MLFEFFKVKQYFLQVKKNKIKCREIREIEKYKDETLKLQNLNNVQGLLEKCIQYNLLEKMHLVNK